MKIIEIGTLQIEITDNTYNAIRTYNMSINQEILIRNKHDAKNLSRKTNELSEASRKQRLEHALHTNDMLYLNSIFENVSMLDLIKVILSRKLKNDS